ncbi:MAG: hypothetical protein P1V51_04050 [Deltaproteobacteria bacterium]|nr:hypothetical protein [Deltaproteobacteria bacterium]
MPTLLRPLSIVVLTLAAAWPRAGAASTPGYVPRLALPTLEAPAAPVRLRLLAEERYDVAKLNDGTVLVGKIIRENEVGVVFRTADGKTRLIKYEELADLQSTKPAAASPGPPAHATPGVPPPHAAGRGSLTPQQAERRRMLAAERDGLVEQRAKISLLPSTLGLIGGLALIAVSPLLVNNSTELTALIVCGGLIAGLGALGLIFKVIGRSQLDRQIREKNREIQKLYPETTRVPAPLPVGGFELALVANF